VSEPELFLSSSLQYRILQIVCTNQNVTYKVLMENTKRDRITVLQSVESLIKRDLIVKQKSNPEFEKSKLIFKPTLSGKNYAVNILKVDLEDILKLETDEEIINYLEFIKDITNPIQRRRLIDPLSVLFASMRSYQETRTKGKISKEYEKKIVKKALKQGILEVAQDNNYDAKNLLNQRSIKYLNNLLTPKEIEELEHSLVTVRDNLIKTTERLRFQT
jgi:predicted transcriptional regulator